MTATPARITESFAVREVAGRSRGGRQVVKLLEPLEYRVGSDTGPAIVVPCGFETDFASIPFGVRDLFPPMGLWGRPAIIHDFLYRIRGEVERVPLHLADEMSATELQAYADLWRARPDINIAPQTPGYTRAQADAVFAEAMAVVGVSAWRRTIMYRAVRLGGFNGWGR